MHGSFAANDDTNSEELTRLREENQQLQNLLTNISVHERMFHSLFELSHDAIILLDGDTIFDCNHTAESLFFLPHSELIKKNISVLLNTEDFNEFQQNLSAAANEAPQFFEFQFLRKDGQLLECEVSVAALMLYNRQFYMVSIRDITERKKVENHLRVRTAQLQATMNSFPFDFWINDTHNCTIMQNPGSKKLWGDQLGNHLEQVTDDETIKALWRETNQKALQGEVVETEQSYSIGGRDMVFRNIVAPIWEDDKVIGILGLNIDITEYKSTQNKLSTALEERETLLREIHHRVKNNLQLIISLLNLQKPNTSPENLDVMNNIENRINSMALIHDQLYDSSTLSRINIPEYFSQLANSINESFNPNHSLISIYVDSIDVNLPIDTALPLGIIVNELVSNSIKYAFEDEEQGDIWIVFRKDPDKSDYILEVRDNGKGIESSSVESGSGLGLTLVQQLSLQIRGTLSIDPVNTNNDDSEMKKNQADKGAEHKQEMGAHKSSYKSLQKGPSPRTQKSKNKRDSKDGGFSVVIQFPIAETMNCTETGTRGQK